MNIVHICSYSYGGAGSAAYRLHQALCKEGLDSKFLSLDTLGKKEIAELRIENNDNSEFPGKIVWEKIQWRLRHHLNIDISNFRRRIENKLSAKLPFIKSEITTLPFSDVDILKSKMVSSADIIHLHWVAGILDFRSFFIKNEIPIIWTLHDQNPFSGIFHLIDDEKRNSGKIGNLDSQVKRFKNNLIKSSKGKLTFVSPSTALMTKFNLCELSSFPIKLIPNCIDTSVFAPRDVDCSTFENANLPKSGIKLLFISQNVDSFNKGFDLLSSALTLLRELPILNLIVAGNSGNFRPDSSNIKFASVLSTPQKLSSFYSYVDALVIPSRDENLPNVMLESFACGTPVISFKVGGMLDHIKNFETGLLAEKMTAESLAETIKLFIENKERFDRGRIRKYAENNFGERIIATQYIRLYKSLMSEEKPKP